MKKKCLLLAGTRPEAIKLAPLIKELEKNSEYFEVRVCAAGQHREMLHQAFSDFNIKPDIDLHVMQPNQSLASLTARLFVKIDELLDAERPDAVLVQGDTATVMVAALCAFYRNIPVGHIEAGLRSFNRRVPFPEELNRRIATIAADMHFCPTETARENLLREGINFSDTFVTGNTVVDALLITLEELQRTERPYPQEIRGPLGEDKRVVLITGHRRESFGDGFQNICKAILQLSKMHPDVHFVYPVHLNPNVQGPVQEYLKDKQGIHLIPPLGYKDFIQLLKRSYLILSDSGGIQEEAPSLGKPVLVMRELTERPEGIKAGTSTLVGTNVDQMTKEVTKLLTNAKHYGDIAKIRNPFGDGQASKHIVQILKERL